VFKQDEITKVEAQEKLKHFFKSKFKYFFYILLLTFIVSFINPFVIFSH